MSYFLGFSKFTWGLRKCIIVGCPGNVPSVTNGKYATDMALAEAKIPGSVTPPQQIKLDNLQGN